MTQHATAAYDKAATYTNLVVGIGYVGFSSIWDKTKNYLSKEEAIMSALFIAISLLVYVFWEVGKMIWTAYYLPTSEDFQNILIQDFAKGVEKYKKAQQDITITFMRWWHIILIATILPAAIAVLILLCSFYRLLGEISFKGA